MKKVLCVMTCPGVVKQHCMGRKPMSILLREKEEASGESTNGLMSVKLGRRGTIKRTQNFRGLPGLSDRRWIRSGDWGQEPLGRL